MQQMYFIGVTTAQSTINRVFPAWARALGLTAELRGIDIPLDATPAAYRDVVAVIKRDPNIAGALVTSHKLNLYRACRDLFDYADPRAISLAEVSCISKSGSALHAHAKDPITAGAAFNALFQPGHWQRSRGELLLLGAGGAASALTLHVHEAADRGDDVPARLIITDRNPQRLGELETLHRALPLRLPAEYHLASVAADNDSLLAKLPPGSLAVNATGLGKDAPGSPLSDRAVFPQHGIVWEFNYRGALKFLDQARAQQSQRELAIYDGWV